MRYGVGLYSLAWLWRNVGARSKEVEAGGGGEGGVQRLEIRNGLLRQEEPVASALRLRGGAEILTMYSRWRGETNCFSVTDDGDLSEGIVGLVNEAVVLKLFQKYMRIDHDIHMLQLTRMI